MNDEANDINARQERERAGQKQKHARLSGIFAFLMRIVKPVAGHKFNLTYETIDGIGEPYLVLSNHNTDWDCIFVGLASKRQLYFVATEKLMRMGFAGKLVIKLFNPILHYKGKQGMNTVKAIYRHMKQGHNVAMFPEGNRSFNGVTCPIPPATGKMARACGGTLVTYRWSGGYFSSPRWGEHARRGKIEGHIAGVYTHEQLERMTDEEIRTAIERDLYVDAYEDQRKCPVAFTGRNKALGLESMLFMCPRCGRIGSMRSKGDRLRDEQCGFDAVFTEYGYLEYDEQPEGYTKTECGQKDENVRKSAELSELDRIQREKIEEMYRLKPEGCLFSDTVIRETIDSGHKLTERVKTAIRAFADRLEIGDAVIPFDKIEGLAINQQNLLLVHIADSDVHYECDGPRTFSALKYLYLCRAAKGSVNGIL